MATNYFENKRAAIIGLGFMGEKHAQAYLNLGVQRLVGAELNEETRKTILQKYPNVIVYADWQELFEKERLDIVSVVTNGPSHAEIVIAAAKKKIPVIFCEKPMATNLADADRMIEACRANGTELFINMTKRAFPSYQKLFHFLAEGAIGSMVNVTAIIGGARGLGCVGSHFFDLMRLFTKSEVHGAWGVIDQTGTPNRRGAQFFDPGGYGVFQFQNGSRGIIEMSEDFFLPPTLIIIGTKGRIEIDEHRNDWRIYRLDGGGPSGKEISTKTTLTPIPFDPGDPIDLVSATERALINIVTKKTMARGEDGLAALEMVLALHISHARNNSFIPLPLRGEDRHFDIPIT